MGLNYQSVLGDASPFPPVSGSVVWLVGRVVNDLRMEQEWHIQGIALTEEIAVNMCRDEDYFIGPIPINVAFPHGPIQWIGTYFPLRDKKDHDSDEKNGQSGTPVDPMKLFSIVIAVICMPHLVMGQPILPRGAGEDLIPTLWFLVNIAASIYSTYILVRSKGREEARAAAEQRADSLGKLLQVRDIEILQLSKENADLQEELESVGTEYKTLAAIKLDELFTFFATMNDTNKEIRILRERVEVLTRIGQEVHKTDA